MGRSDRHARQVQLSELGADGQARLEAARVLVVGAGGLGAPVMAYLAAAGVGGLTVVDDDHVELSNLNRQVLHRTADLGRRKAERAAEWVRELDPDLEINGLSRRVSVDNARELVAAHDVVVDGADGLPTKYLLNDAAVRERRPLVRGAITGFSGEMMVIAAGGGPCLRCVFPTVAPPTLVKTCREIGVLGASVGVLGSLMALEVIKLCAGIGSASTGKSFRVETGEVAIHAFHVDANPACPACGEAPEIDARTAADYEVEP